MIKVICQCGRVNEFPQKMIGKVWKCSACNHKTKIITNKSFYQKTSSAPKKIGPYTILSELGRGGMGVVYKVEESQTGQTYALKVLLSLRGANQKRQQRFQREAEVLLKLDHPNIVRFVGSGTENDLSFMVTELVKGHSLKEFIKQKPLPYEVALTLANKIADALKHAHAQGIIHRDIKPSNIVIDSQYKPVLLDFGIAKTTDMQESLTRSGAMIGTPQYMSPEQAQGKKKEIDARTDIYSLGCILYEMITGKPVIEHKDISAIVRSVIYDTPMLSFRQQRSGIKTSFICQQ